MMGWQSCHLDGGGRAHRQFRKAAFDSRCQDLVRRNLKIIPPQSRFDGDFPNADGAKHNVIIRALDGGAQRIAKSLRRSKRPEQDMSIQQQAHYRPSNSSKMSEGKGASKFSGIDRRPTRSPRRRSLRPVPAVNGTSLARGVPAFAMMISSPAAASSTKRDKWVLAAWMLTVVMGSSLKLHKLS